MSDTPKRNEAVARWHMRLNPISGNVYIANEKPAKDLSTEYVLLSDYEALQGEVSRLRGRTYELEAFIRHWIGDGLLQTFNNREIFRAAAATILAPNLEPPTDGP